MTPDLDAGRGPWGVLEVLLDLDEDTLAAADEYMYARGACSSMGWRNRHRPARVRTTREYPVTYNPFAVERSADSRWRAERMVRERARAATLARERVKAAAWLAAHERQVEAQRLADQAAHAQAQAQAAHRRDLERQIRDAAKQSDRLAARLLWPQPPGPPPGWLQATRPVVTVTPKLLREEPWRAKLLNYRGGTIKLEGA